MVLKPTMSCKNIVSFEATSSRIEIYLYVGFNTNLIQVSIVHCHPATINIEEITSES